MRGDVFPEPPFTERLKVLPNQLFVAPLPNWDIVQNRIDQTMHSHQGLPLSRINLTGSIRPLAALHRVRLNWSATDLEAGNPRHPSECLLLLQVADQFRPE